MPGARRRALAALPAVALALLHVAAALPAGLQAELARVAAKISEEFNCSVSIAVRDAHDRAAVAYGTVDYSTGRRASTKDRYAWGSITKMLTGASILRLVDAGDLSLHDEVAPIVDPLLARMATANPEQKYSSMADIWGAEHVQGTTIYQLLSMTSGMPDFDTAEDCGKPSCPDPLRASLYKDWKHAWSPTKLMGADWVAQKWKEGCNKVGPLSSKLPPESFCYSSTSYIMLGMVLAAKANAASWQDYDQGAPLPAYLKEKLTFATKGAPKKYTHVHGYDRTTYNVKAGEHADHDNWEVAGVFSGWTASNTVATPEAVADLTWEIYGPEHKLLPEKTVNLMLPPTNGLYGLATMKLNGNTGQNGGKYGRAYGHMGATYGYQSMSAYFPALQAVITVGTNIERNEQEQPAAAMCLAHGALAGMTCTSFKPCKCSFPPDSDDKKHKPHKPLPPATVLELAGLAGAVAAKPLENQKKIRGAWCGTNAATAVQYLSRAGITIALAVTECAAKRTSTDGINSACAADVNMIWGSFLWAAAYISLATTECAAHANLNAVCAGLIEALVGAIGTTAAAGEVARTTCKVPPQDPYWEAPFPVRRLQDVVPERALSASRGKDAVPERALEPKGVPKDALLANPAYTPDLAAFDAKVDFSQESADLETAMCVQDAVQAATVLAQFGVAVDQTIFACPLSGLAAFTEEWCAVEVGLMLLYMFQTASMVAASVSHCGKAIGIRMGSMCMASIMDVIASVSGITTLGAGIDMSCPGTKDSLKDHFGLLANPIAKVSALGRRLGDGVNGTVREQAAAIGYSVRASLREEQAAGAPDPFARATPAGHGARGDAGEPAAHLEEVHV